MADNTTRRNAILLAAGAVAAVFIGLAVFRKGKKLEVTKGKDDSLAGIRQARPAPSGFKAKKMAKKAMKRQARYPVSVDGATKFKKGEQVEVSQGHRGWMKGEITSEAKLSKGGTVLYMVRRASSRYSRSHTQSLGDVNHEEISHSCPINSTMTAIFLAGRIRTELVKLGTSHKSRSCLSTGFVNAKIILNAKIRSAAFPFSHN